MKGIERKIREIKEQKIGNSQKKVLVVEGSDDVRSFEMMLSKMNSSWSNSWAIAQAGNKSTVIEILGREPGWLGIVDRDEWDEEKISQLINEKSNLLFLPRYCIENYLIVPSELWAALPEKQKAKIPNGLEQLENLILFEKDKWVRHGVLWSVINPLWEGLRSLGFKEALLDVAVVTNDVEIQRILGDWHAFLNPNHIWHRYQQRLADVHQKSDEEKLRIYVHGKRFYEQVVNPVLNQLLGQKAADERQFSIIRTLPTVTDLTLLVDKMGLNDGDGE